MFSFLKNHNYNGDYNEAVILAMLYMSIVGSESDKIIQDCRS